MHRCPILRMPFGKHVMPTLAQTPRRRDAWRIKARSSATNRTSHTATVVAHRGVARPLISLARASGGLPDPERSYIFVFSSC